MKPQNLEPILKQSPFFADFAEEHLATILGCASLAVYHEGESLLREGQNADHFFLIREGRISIELHIPGQGEVTLQTLSKGEVLGWSWIIPPHRYDFDATARELTRVVKMDAVCLRQKCDADPALGYPLLKRFSAVMTQRLLASRLQLLDLYGLGREQADG